MNTLRAISPSQGQLTSGTNSVCSLDSLFSLYLTARRSWGLGHELLYCFCLLTQSCPTTPWTAACQAFQSFIISQSFLILMSFESVMPSNHLILCHPLLLLLSVFPASGSFPMSRLFIIWWLKYSASASASVIPLNIQDLFPLGLTGLISLLSRGLSRVFSSTPFGDISCLVLNLFYRPALTSIHDYWKNHSFDYMDVCQQMSLEGRFQGCLLLGRKTVANLDRVLKSSVTVYSLDILLSQFGTNPVFLV